MPRQKPLTHDTLSEFVRAHRFALIHFWAAWNGYDAQMRSIIESQIPESWSKLVGFASLDVDPEEHSKICLQHDVRNLPFLAFYRDGSLTGSHTGMLAGEALVERLNQFAKVRVSKWSRRDITRLLGVAADTPSRSWFGNIRLLPAAAPFQIRLPLGLAGHAHLELAR